MTCVLCMFADKSYEDTRTSVSVEFLWVQWSEACWSIPSKGQLFYCASSSKSSTVLSRFLWVLEVANTAFGNTNLICLWGIKRVDCFQGGLECKRALQQVQAVDQVTCWLEHRNQQTLWSQQLGWLMNSGQTILPFCCLVPLWWHPEPDVDNEPGYMACQAELRADPRSH